MPITEEGIRADILLNSLGVWNRLNPSQLQEQFINMMSDRVLNLMKAEEDIQAKADIFFSYMKAINKAQYDFLDIEYIGMNRQQKKDFIDSIERDGIYVHQPPFFGNTSEEDFKRIFKEHPEWCEPYKFIGIEKPMVMGDEYFIKLKHEPSNKSSIRSAGNLNTKNIPAKSTLKKEKRVLYSQNPLRLGEMEVQNLLIAKDPQAVEKLLKTYSTNEHLREETILQLINPLEDSTGKQGNAMDMNIKVDLENNKSISREILDKYLNVLGYAITESGIKGSDVETKETESSPNSSLETAENPD